MYLGLFSSFVFNLIRSERSVTHQIYLTMDSDDRWQCSDPLVSALRAKDGQHDHNKTRAGHRSDVSDLHGASNDLCLC